MCRISGSARASVGGGSVEGQRHYKAKRGLTFTRFPFRIVLPVQGRWAMLPVPPEGGATAPCIVPDDAREAQRRLSELQVFTQKGGCQPERSSCVRIRMLRQTWQGSMSSIYQNAVEARPKAGSRPMSPASTSIPAVRRRFIVGYVLTACALLILAGWIIGLELEDRIAERAREAALLTKTVEANLSYQIDRSGQVLA